MSVLGTISEDQQNMLMDLEAKVEQLLKRIGKLEYEKNMALDSLRTLELKGQAVINSIRSQLNISPEQSFKIENGKVILVED